MKIIKSKIIYLGVGVLILAIGGLAIFEYKPVQANPVPASSKGINLPIPRGSITLPVLMYHHIGQYPADADAIRKDLTVPTVNFEQQISWLSSQGYHSVDLEQFYLYTLGKFQLPTKPIIFSFDDGYEDALQNTVPILKHYGYSGSFAIITQWPGQTQGSNVYASWDEVVAAQNQGMEIVCHTQNHFDGTNLEFTADYIYQNLSGCKTDLANHHINTNILIYPYGHYSAQYIEQAQKAGFVMGVTVKEGDNINLESLMEVPRVRVHGAEDLQRFEGVLLHKQVVVAAAAQSKKP